MYYSWYLAVSHEEKNVCDSTETEKETEHKSTIMEMRNIVINQERVIEELILEKLYQKETYITFVLLLLCYYYIIIVIQIFLYYIYIYVYVYIYVYIYVCVCIYIYAPLT